MNDATPIAVSEACRKVVPAEHIAICYDRRSAIASERSADSASWQNGLSIASLILSIIGTIALYYTFRETRKTTRASLAAALEAKRANDLARELASNETRPWIALKQFLSKRVYDKGRTHDGPPDGQAFAIEWLNGGVSTALIKRRGERLVVLRSGDQEPSFENLRMYDEVSAVGPGSFFITPYQTIKGSDYIDVISGEAIALMRCHVVYSHPKRPSEHYRSEMTMRFMVSNQVKTADGKGLVSDMVGAQFGSLNVFT